MNEENHFAICPFCGGDNVSIYENGRFKLLHCSDCEQDCELHRMRANLIRKYGAELDPAKKIENI